MSYQDPYSSHRAAGSSSHPQPYEGQDQRYSQGYPQQQPYDDSRTTDPYNAYAPDQIEYSYSDNRQAGYNDYPPPQRSGTRTSKLKQPAYVSTKETSGFERGEFVPKVEKSRTPSALRAYRYDHQGNLWTKGGRGRCAARVCCCTLMTTVFLIVSIVLSLALWVRPPTITIGDVQTMSVDGTTIQQTANGLLVNLGVPISVHNPNYFSVDFKKIEADILYPINDFPIGDGSANNILFKSGSQINFTFPFELKYNSTADVGNKVILDIAQKCGVATGSTKENIVVNYKIRLGIRILAITVSPVISNQFSFPCPLSSSDIQKFLGSG